MIENFSRRIFRGSSGTYNVYALELAASTLRKLKGLELTVHFLDHTEHVFHVDKRLKGSVLLDLVYQHLELVEKDYFGLQYPEDKSGNQTECMVWLDPSKTLKKQLTNCQTDLYFKVKFYVSDPSKLQQEYTRYQFYLQIKKDIFEEKLIVPPSTAILLASYMVQSELGDYCPEEQDEDYLSHLQLVPGQTPELEKNISELHKLHKGKLPADAEFHFLDHAKKIDMYGVDLHNALDNMNKSIQLGVTHIGLVIFRNNIKFNTFSWSKIMKISFKRKQFFIQLRREPSEDYDTILVFNMESYKSAKKLWKSCVEHHTFFRLHSPKVKRKFPFSLGSKFSYSGRTEFQTVTEVQQKGKIEHKFVRSPSRQIIKQIISTATPSLEEKGKTPTAPNRPPRPYDNKVTSLGSKGPRKAWGAESQISSDDGDILEKPLDVPFSPGKILSYADEDMPSPTSNGLYDTPPYSASHSPVSQIIEEGSVTITLYPDEEGKYGFNVKGGMAKGIPIVVMKVAPNTPADTCTPRLSEGDQILQINGKEMSSSTYEEAVRLIQEARTTDDGKLVLQVKPNVVYSGLDEYEEPPYQYVPIGDVEAVQSGNPLEQSMLLLADGLASGAVVVRFEALYRKHPDMTCDESAKPKNVNKNRYRDISPYDETRVILKNGSNGDYINANYVNMSINSTDIVNRYIATQGPLQSTTEDFWQMILEERCTLIIMLTTLVERGRTKCHKYWPSVGENLTVQDTTIKCIKEETDLTGSVVFRDFVLTNSETEELREIKHIQYVVWPDHGVPSSPAQFLSFTEQVREARKDEAPVIVHCSAGIGRTGVLILMETAMCLIENEEPVYPLEIVKTMREQRAMMIQNADTIAKLWKTIEDIFSVDNFELRNTGFNFLINLIKRQNEELKITRAEFFRFIKNHNNPQDVGQRLQLLIALTSNGKNVLHFEEEIGPFLLGWYSEIQHINNVVEYLELILNIIKFNAVCLNSFILSGLVDLICILCCGTYEPKTISCCLQILETVIAYSNMPADALPRLIGALCRTVNNEEFCTQSWKVGKNLLGTHMGHASMYTLCLILQEPGLKSQIYLLRGAVFFVHMSLWSAKPVANLCVPPSAVLPSLLEAVKTNHPFICYEVILGIYALVQKLGLDLSKPVWSIVLEIIQHVHNTVESNMGQHTSNLIVQPMHETLDIIENLIDNGYFMGPLNEFFDIIKACANSRPESSVLRLIEYMSRDIISTEQCWLTNLNNLLNKFFRSDEVRTDIRLAALNVLSGVAHLNRKNYEEELIENIVIPHCTYIVNDPNVIVRSAVAKCLLSLCVACETKRCVEMLDILEKLMFRPFEVYTDHSPSEAELKDILSLVEGLIDVFIYKLERLPSSHAVKMYKILLFFLETHYKRPSVFVNCYRIRYLIFECFLKMRADDEYRLGYLKDEKTINYSPYLCVTSHSREKGVVGSPLPQSPAVGQHGHQCSITYVSIKRAFRVFISCLNQEKDWNVLRLVLQELPKVMRNKTLILSKHGNIQLDLLVDVLSPTILDKQFTLPEHFNKIVSKHDYLHLFFNVLVTLPSYHACLDQKHQQYLVRCLSRSIGNSLRTSPKQLIEALTICCLEMRDVMVKMLPEILLTVSKISPTVLIAIPVLEFLSTLTQLPMVYASFVDKQYLAVFAITSPFTNPFKYNHYTVSLAHYVIGVWFLKCRLPIRINFVRFITSALQTNVLTPFEETNFFNKVDLSKLNLDSSDRKRSSSLTEQGPRRRAATVSGGSGATAAGASGSQENKNPPYKSPVPLPIPLTAANASVLTFYEELTETCIDLMARYAFSPSSALPRRTPTAEFLLNGGQSMSWLLGNKMITITTSGCSQKVLKHGLCDKCWHVCSNEHRGQKSARSSIENAEAASLTRQNSNDKMNPETVSPVDEKTEDDKNVEVQKKLEGMVSPYPDKYEKPLCSCWCQAWAEIFVRRPTGDMSWVMRIQNTISSKSSINEFPLKELTHLFMPSVAPGSSNINKASGSRGNSEDTGTESGSQEKDKEDDPPNLHIRIPGSSTRNSPSRQSSRDSGDEDMEYIYDDGTKTRNPVRRSNSSPEMSNWKNPFMHSKHDDEKNVDEDGSKKGKLYSKDMRVSCEAIPEEMAGTTPPSNEALLLSELNLPGKKPHNPTQTHPSLLSCHSYPGSSPPKESNIAPKACQTVPVTPNVMTTASNLLLQKGNLSKNSSSDLSVESVKSDKELEKSGLAAHAKVHAVSSKPPQSPTQTSSKVWILKDKEGNEIQKSASASVLDRNSSTNRDTSRDRKSTGNIDKLSDFDPQKRDRTHTVAGTSHGVRKPRSEQLKQLTRPREAPKSGINPSFVFLQIYQKVDFADSKEKPILIGTDEPIRRAISNLDRIPPYETHKIGVIYIREGQVNKESEILKNSFGSIRYGEFLRRLGTLFKLQDVDPQLHFLGGLSQNGDDGKFSYMWQDDLVKMIFHVATLMPNKESDPNCISKKLHIGNDNVTIVYNESGEEYNINTIRSQFNFASVIIQPMDQNLNRVTVKCKEELVNLMGAGCQETKIVSDQSVAILARQLALHANLASLVHGSLHANSQSPYASNWLERLRQIKKIRTRIVEAMDNPSQPESSTSNPKSRQKQMEDFTEYT